MPDGKWDGAALGVVWTFLKKVRRGRAEIGCAAYIRDGNLFHENAATNWSCGLVFGKAPVKRKDFIQHVVQEAFELLIHRLRTCRRPDRAASRAFANAECG